MYKITYFGANGRVGRNTLILLVNSLPKNHKMLEILLVPSNSIDSIQRLSGFIKDINGLVSISHDNGMVCAFVVLI